MNHNQNDGLLKMIRRTDPMILDSSKEGNRNSTISDSQGLDFSNIFEIVCVLLGVLAMWALVSYVVGSLIRVIINAFMKGVKDEYDDDEYPPVKKLLNIGFIKQKPDAAAQYGSKIDNDKQAKYA